MTDQPLVQEITSIIAEQLGVDKKDVTPEKSFIEHLNADSLDLTEMVMNLEEHFDLEIPDDQAEKLKTVQDVINFVTANKK